jgi:hypothetical protein
MCTREIKPSLQKRSVVLFTKVSIINTASIHPSWTTGKTITYPTVNMYTFRLTNNIFWQIMLVILALRTTE